MAVWAITMPLYSGPDEPSQAAHAAALVRGQLFGTPVRNFRFPGADVTVPGTLGNGTDDISCYWYHPAIPASCAAGVRLTSRPVAALTYSSRYPPLYYAATGLVTLVDQSSSTLIYMRLVGALMCSVLLGLAYMALAVWSANRVLPVGFLCALTPMAVYLGGVLNPSGLEIAAAICLWASGVVLMLEHAEDPPPGLVLVVAASAVVLTCTRGLSPLFALLSIVALAALVGQQTVARLFRSRRDVRWGALALIVVAVVTVAWVLYAHSLSLLPAGSRVSPSASDLSIVGQAFGQTRIWLEQMVGVLGWGDASMPSWTYRVWGLVLVLLVLLALRSRHRQGLLVLGWLIGLSLLLPVAISLVDARSIGIVWTGRYTLPLAVGVPVLAAALGGAGANAPPVWLRRTLLLALAAASLLGYLETLRRYAVGIHGPYDFLGGPWRPIEGWPLALTWYVAASGLLVTLLWRLTASPTHRPSGTAMPWESVPQATAIAPPA